MRNMLFTAASEQHVARACLMVDSDRRVIVCNKRFHDMFHDRRVQRISRHNNRGFVPCNRGRAEG